MYRAVAFDLDGTLVQTEKLKAISYAKAVAELSPVAVAERDVFNAFTEVVGRSRQEVSTFLVRTFDLEQRAHARLEEFGVYRTWQVLAQRRLQIYERMLQDPAVFRSNQWPYSIQLLKRVRKHRCATALATMSSCQQATRALEILGLRAYFDVVATRDDVENPKPDPEIYLSVSRELQVPPRECLVIEDSPAGGKAATCAGMDVIAVTTPFTREQFRKQELLDRRFVVDEPSDLPHVMWERLLAHQRERHGA